MKTHRLFIVGFLALVLVLTACGSSTPATPAASASPSPRTLDDSLVRAITPATLSGDFHTPLDSTPDLNGTTIYFTASSSHGAGVFRVPTAGGTATAVFIGSPFVTPRGIAISPDGQQLYVADPGADKIFRLATSGGIPSALQGSTATAPQNLHVVSQGGQQIIYFTGKDPSSGQPAILTLPAAGATAPSIVVKGASLVAPDGVVVAQSGILYVADRLAAGGGDGKVFKIDHGTVTPIVEQVKLGNPAGIALSADESLSLVSAYQGNSSYDQVLAIELATQRTGSVTKVVGQNSNPGGLHASPGKKDLFSWCGIKAGGNGTVFQVTL